MKDFIAYCGLDYTFLLCGIRKCTKDMALNFVAFRSCITKIQAGQIFCSMK